MDLQYVINSRYSIGLAIGVGSHLPSGPGYWLADTLSSALAGLRYTKIVRAVRLNQWVISGGAANPAELSRRTRTVFRHTGRGLYNFYHNLNNPQAVLKLVRFSPEFEESHARIRSGREGTLFVCPHLSNFDLVGRAMALRGIHMQLLSFPQPVDGYRRQNRLRDSVGMVSTPMSPSALRQAIANLRRGGVVITGMDRPVPSGGHWLGEDHPDKYLPIFFGRPARLPVAHVRLGLKLGLPVTVVAARAQPDGSYVLMASHPIPMDPDPDPVKEVTRNAEKLLRVAEAWIRQTPEQWAMFYPVWPEAEAEMLEKR